MQQVSVRDPARHRFERTWRSGFLQARSLRCRRRVARPAASHRRGPPRAQSLCASRSCLVRKQIMRRVNCVLYAAQDCSGCALKPRCTTAARRFEADPGLMRQRRCAAEHPFGTIKRMTAGGRFLIRGLTKVKATRLSSTKDAPDRPQPLVLTQLAKAAPVLDLSPSLRGSKLPFLAEP